jgi:diguanylate cyclase (GGDEF)-like protein
MMKASSLFWHRNGEVSASPSPPNTRCAENAGAEELDTITADPSPPLAALRAIVDDLDYGIVVLDQERRVQFINRAFRRFWQIPDELAESKPTFIKLMYHARGVSPYAVSHDRLGDYVAKQLASIRTGEERPLNIQLRNGEVLQFRCKALANGGRLLTYGNVSEIVHQAEALERLASVDGMTGLNNRRNFLVLAENEWSRAVRYGRPLAVLMVDIDLFKSINDTYGHDVGDDVIKAVADVLNVHKRASDIAGRLGGEEFALMLPEATLDSAVAAGERLRQRVAERVIAVEASNVSVTISIGACARREDLICVDAMLKQADVALYKAKRSGRNRVCWFTP